MNNNLNAAQLNELKKIFFRNIGYHTMAVIADISDTMTEYLDLNNTECDVSYVLLYLSSNDLNNVKKFREIKINDANIQEVKKQWSEELGENVFGIIA